ncbi:MAG: 2-phospho-L-lactate guanylyltransferase [Halioglobus sp.]
MKDLVQAKSRLSGLLRPSERRALAQAMAEDVLAVLSRHAQIDRVTLVSDDPGAGMLAAQYQVEFWDERTMGAVGLNAVIQAASERLLSASASPLVVLHADLPLLTEADITEVLRVQQQLAGLVIACDQRGTGTNLLAFTRDSTPQFCFGADSCARHIAVAHAAGMPVQVVRRFGIAVDVDEPQDMQTVIDALQQRCASKTCDLLQGTGLGARVELALATLDGKSKLDKGMAL